MAARRRIDANVQRLRTTRTMMDDILLVAEKPPTV
jgi:hypothetical protein